LGTLKKKMSNNSENPLEPRWSLSRQHEPEAPDAVSYDRQSNSLRLDLRSMFSEYGLFFDENGVPFILEDVDDVPSPEEELAQPLETDVVLGGQAPPPLGGVVLGGLESVRHRLDRTQSEAVRIAALADALKYGAEGLQLLKQVTLNETGEVQWSAYDLHFNASGEAERRLLLEFFPLQSTAGVDYSGLRNLLAAGDWKAADAKTSEHFLDAIGQSGRSYLEMDDLLVLPSTDLQTIDRLWVKCSGGRFGLSIQQKIFAEEVGTFEFEKVFSNWGLVQRDKYRKFVERLGHTEPFWSKFQNKQGSKILVDDFPVGFLPTLANKEIRGGIFYHSALLSRPELK
jgi:GUN4-like